MSEIMIRQARQSAAELMSEAGIDSAALDARVLLAHVLGVTQAGLFACDLDHLPEQLLHRYEQLVSQRSDGLPVAYLTGAREFMGLTFQTTPEVLVPRPDTESLVEWALDWIASHPEATVADIGTGSGAIAISVTFHAVAAWYGITIATDISDTALDVARINADAILSPDRRKQMAFRSGSLTEPLDVPVDLILANLPYLTPAQMRENAHLRHEPGIALDGGTDGLGLIRKVIDDLPRVLSPHGAVGFEIDPSQSMEVWQLLRTALPDHRISVVHDLAGEDRHVVAI